MALGLFPLIAIFVGLLASANFLIERMPNAKSIIQKISPYQAVLGMVALVWGVLALVSWGGAAGRMGFINTLNSFACIGCTAVAGFLLGFPLLQSYVLDDMSEKARKRGDNLRKSLSPFQLICGLVALGTGAYLFLFVSLPYLFR